MTKMYVSPLGPTSVFSITQRAQRRQTAHGLSQKWQRMTNENDALQALNCKRAFDWRQAFWNTSERIQPPPWLPSRDGSTRSRGHAPRAKQVAEGRSANATRAREETAANSDSVLASTSGQEPIPPELASSAVTSCPACEPVPQSPPRPQGALGWLQGPTYKAPA